MDKDLQVENGNFTRIVNPLIENLIKVPFKGCELAVALLIIRKTYGYQKKEDQLSLSQICKGVERSRPTVVKALENLKLVNIAKLVSIGDSKKRSNIWSINKYSNDWKLVNIAKLVKTTRATSKDGYTLTSKDGLTHKRKKERIQKKYATTSVADMPLSKKKDEEPYTRQQFIESMRASPQRHVRIIGEYADQIKPNLITKGQWRVFSERNMRAARLLSPFNDSQITEAFGKLEKDVKSTRNPKGFITKWGLETLIKYIT